MNALTSINIGDTAIRQTTTNQYCINDLHKAAGALSKNQPSKFLLLNSTKELIQEINKTGNLVLEQNQAVKVIHGGNQQGTYVAKELVYAYAMWISPAFCLKVIRTFDALGTVQPKQISVSQRDYAELQAKHDTMQAELLELYRFKIAILESQLDKPSRTSTPLSADEKTEILRLNSLGHSRSEIVELTGRSDTAIYYLLRHAATDAKGSIV